MRRMGWKWAVSLACIFLGLAQVRGNEAEEEEEDDLASTNIILFLFFGLGVGILAMQSLSFVGEKVPYTVLIFMLGAVLSLGDNKNDRGSFGESISEWVNINADLMLFIFLPPLVFGEAMNLNWYYFKGGLSQAVLLAGPGVLIGAALMGVFCKLFLPYDWPWNLSMLLGSILSATDTVAMVSLLKSVGASPKLTILIVGESLINDGSAMVLFTIFYNSVNGKLYTAGSIISYVLTTVLGSLALGAGIGLVALRWLRSANRPLVETDVTVQIAVTICCAYLTFFVAQNTLGLSGILACVSAGSVLAWLAPPVILDHVSMHNVWGMVEWSLNTVIFLLSGLIIGHRILSKVRAMDWFYCVILYIALNVVRGITVSLLYPALSTLGHKCTPNEAIFTSWAGLRGALGMALAMIVENNCPDDIRDQTSRLFFYVGGIASLTLLINATSAKSLLMWLGLGAAESPEKALVTSQIKRKLQRKTDRYLAGMAQEFALTSADIEEVRMSCTLFNELRIEDLMRETEVIPPNDLLDMLTARRNSTATAHRLSTNTVSHQHGASLRAALTAGWDAAEKAGSAPHHPSSASSPPASASSSFSFPLPHPSSRPPVSNEGGSSRPRSLSRYRSQELGRSLASKHMTTSLLHARHMSRLLSLHAKGPSNVVMPELIIYVRAIFLEIVRVKYWHFIEIGKLPRLSFSAQFLLYTIDSGLDQCKDGGAMDWKCLKEEISHRHWDITLLESFVGCVPAAWSKSPSRLLAFLHARNEKRTCYMLSAFIEAHEHAQKKIHAFLGLTEEEDTLHHTEAAVAHRERAVDSQAHPRPHLHPQTGKTTVADDDDEEDKNSDEGDEKTKAEDHPPAAEELVVIDESKAAVEKARAILQSMNAETLEAIKSKQVARVVLAKQAELVQQMVHEGLLTSNYAADFLEEISQDTQRIEKERNRMYRLHGEKRAREMQAELEQRDSAGGRFTFFTMKPFGRPSHMQQRDTNGGERDSMLEDARSACHPLLRSDLDATA